MAKKSKKVSDLFLHEVGFMSVYCLFQIIKQLKKDLRASKEEAVQARTRSERQAELDRARITQLERDLQDSRAEAMEMRDRFERQAELDRARITQLERDLRDSRAEAMEMRARLERQAEQHQEQIAQMKELLRRVLQDGRPSPVPTPAA